MSTINDDWKIGLLQGDVTTLLNKVDKLEEQELVAIHSLLSERYKLKRTIFVNIRKGEELYISSMWDLNLHGQGHIVHEALIDIRHAIIELYNECRDLAEKDELGDLTGRWWLCLQELIDYQPEQSA